MRKFSVLWTIILLGLLPGCTEFKSLWADRYGPDPIVGGQPVGGITAVEAPERQARVVVGFLQANGYQTESNPNFPQNRLDWYNVILTGFNTVDDACQLYINDLWKIERQKNRVKDVIAASGAATAAIIGANANPSAATLQVLASSVGLASSLTGTIGDSYLFAQNPATIGAIVKKLQVAYRTDVAKNLDVTTYPINSLAAVYYHTREYLSLCLPPTIQAQVQDVLAKANAVPAGTPPTAVASVRKSATDVAAAKAGKSTSSVSLVTPGN